MIISIKYRMLPWFVFLLLATHSLLGQIPTGYYSNAAGKRSADLKTALFTIVRPHNQIEYYSSSIYFTNTDWHSPTADAPEGYFWDMYSTQKRTSWYGMNREHSLPKSWWSDAPETTVAYTDLHNLYPSDAAANTAKSNYPLGVVVGAADFNNFVKVGQNGFSVTVNGTTLNYSGKVFEPADEYKGDFARDYMYVVTCYQDYANNWRSLGVQSMLINGSTYPVFKEWAIALLLKWHRDDPVSDKEIQRNNAVYAIQNNRNPYIDHPELAEFIWGKYKGKVWTDDGVLPEEDVNFDVQVYPDKRRLKVMLSDLKNASYVVRNLYGHVVLSGSFDAEGVLDFSSNPAGMYLLEVFASNNQHYIRKIIAGN